MLKSWENKGFEMNQENKVGGFLSSIMLGNTKQMERWNKIVKMQVCDNDEEDEEQEKKKKKGWKEKQT